MAVEFGRSVVGGVVDAGRRVSTKSLRFFCGFSPLLPQPCGAVVPAFASWHWGVGNFRHEGCCVCVWTAVPRFGLWRLPCVAPVSFQSRAFGVGHDERGEALASLRVSAEAVVQVAACGRRGPRSTLSLDDFGHQSVAGLGRGALTVVVSVDRHGRPGVRRSRFARARVALQRLKRPARAREHHTRSRPGPRERVPVPLKQAWGSFPRRRIAVPPREVFLRTRATGRFFRRSRRPLPCLR